MYPAYPGVHYPGPVPSYPALPGYTAVHQHPDCSTLRCQCSPRCPGRTSWAQGGLGSLGRMVLGLFLGQSCLSSSGGITGLLKTAWVKNGQRLDRARSKWLLITLEVDCVGGSWIPGFRLREDRLCHFCSLLLTFAHSVMYPPANGQESSLCAAVTPASLLDSEVFWRF